jgi:MFS family permease
MLAAIASATSVFPEAVGPKIAITAAGNVSGMALQTIRPRRALLALVAANTVSLLGNVVAAVAIPWFVLVTTGSATRTGVAAFFTTLPLALGALFGGAVADRVGLRRTSVAADLASGAAIAGIPILHAAGALDFWLLIGLGVLGSAFDGPGQAAREALLPATAERAGVSLERATALWTTTEHLAYVLGAPLAGVLIAVFGGPGALIADTASFAFSALVVSLAVPAAKAVVRATSYLADFVEGLRFIAREDVVRSFVVLATAGNFLIAPLAIVLLPVYARTEFGGARDLGLLIGVYGAGGLAGAASFAVVARRVPRRTLFVGHRIVYAALWVLLVPLPSLWVSLLCCLESVPRQGSSCRSSSSSDRSERPRSFAAGSAPR